MVGIMGKEEGIMSSSEKYRRKQGWISYIFYSGQSMSLLFQLHNPPKRVLSKIIFFFAVKYIHQYHRINFSSKNKDMKIHIKQY